MRTKNFLFLCLLLLSLASCGTAKKRIGSSKGKMNTTIETVHNPVALEIIENAKAFLGTRYKYGGTTKKGMDCSGLIYTVFSQEDIELPRISRDMSLEGTRLFLREVRIGDLLFFETDKNKKVINHVGLVVKTEPEEIFFIHSSSSQGVIISSLNNNYWRQNFIMARRVL